MTEPPLKHKNHLFFVVKSPNIHWWIPIFNRKNLHIFHLYTSFKTDWYRHVNVYMYIHIYIHTYIYVYIYIITCVYIYIYLFMPTFWFIPVPWSQPQSRAQGTQEVRETPGGNHAVQIQHVAIVPRPLLHGLADAKRCWKYQHLPRKFLIYHPVLWVFNGFYIPAKCGSHLELQFGWLVNSYCK